MNDELQKKLNIGLTKDEVEEQIRKGLVNGDMNIKTKSYGQIIRDNILSLFNLINLILVICVLIAGSLKNGLFFLVVIWNFGIGVVQEIRAKKTIEKLSLITAPKVYALRDGQVVTLQSQDIVLGEIVRLKSGNQICADCVILEGECNVNESLITGESEPVPKRAGDHLLSGSYFISGSTTCEVEHIGADNYVNQITAGAKYVKKNHSVILSSVKSVVRIIAIALVPLAIMMVVKNFFMLDQPFSAAMIATVASISAMIPGGLVLLVSMVMVVSVIRLSMRQTLAQDLYCVEHLARVDVLCLDKTGTITEGEMQVEEIIEIGSLQQAAVGEQTDTDAACEMKAAATEQTAVREMLKEFAADMHDENSTIEAIRSYLEMPAEMRAQAQMNMQVPFSSDRKWSLLKRENGGAYILGAPEMIIKNIPDELREMIAECARRCKRVVAFGEVAEVQAVTPQLPEGITLRALIIIGDKVRENAKETIDYFEAEDVTLKVISGDNPVTVSMIAQEAGLDGAENYIDASELTTYEQIEEAVDRYTIFGRVTPYQKLDIVKALKSHGHSVAMIGDGANDVLALKEADCSIAMQSGSDAARNVASMVLLNSDFAALPHIVAEGRKSINNLQRSAGLYLTKTTYAFILTIVFIFAAFTYPFQSIQVTLIGVVTIGMPSFFLALEPNKNRIRKHFLRNVFVMAVPSGILTVIGILTSVLVSRYAFNASTEQVQTVATFTTIIIGYIVIFNIAGRMNKWKWILIGWIVLVAAFFVILFPKLFSIVPIPWNMTWLIAAVCAGFLLVHSIIFRVIIPRVEKKSEQQ